LFKKGEWVDVLVPDIDAYTRNNATPTPTSLWSLAKDFVEGHCGYSPNGSFSVISVMATVMAFRETEDPDKDLIIWFDRNRISNDERHELNMIIRKKNMIH
jgi:hypothetical protein